MRQHRFSGLPGFSRNGFTLVELVAVIVILGILSATAVPKFTAMQSDARIAILKHMQGSIRSANTMVFAKAMMNSTNTSYSEREAGGTWYEDCRTDNCVQIGDLWVYLKYAYIDRNSVAFILDADISGMETKQVKNSKTGKNIIVPKRDTKVGYANNTCGGGVCEGHDFCQCRVDDRSNKKFNGRDNQFIVPRGQHYPKLSGNKPVDSPEYKCYFRYSSAEYIDNVQKPPIYYLETSGC